MQTSTPVGSPLRRKLSMRQKIVEIEQDEDDLENELQNRRLEAINKSTELRRRSVAAPLLAGLNTAQLAKHCQDCLKLSAENKINTKNAFNFLLIDFMAAMTKKKDSEINKNFQVAGCTLDASVKIYGYRVDAVHGEATKLASGFFKKELQEALDGDGDQSEGEAVGEVKKKPKKKRRKMTLVAPTTLNAKSESEALLDAAPKRTLLSRNADGSTMLTRIPKYNDSCVLMVDADVPSWPFGANEHLVPHFEIGDKCDSTSAMELFQEIPVNTGDKICSVASNVEIGRDVEEDDLNLDCSQTSTFQFDVDASVVEPDCEESVAPTRLAVPCGGYDSGEEIALPEERVRVIPASIVDMKSRLSVHNSEYSMFDEKVLKAWAGPAYWKVRPSRETHGENKENEGVPQAAATKRTRRGRVKELVELFQVPDEVLAKHLEPSIKCLLAKSTLCSWKPAAVSLSEDYKYSAQHLFTLFHLPLKVTQPQNEKSEIDEAVAAEDSEDEGFAPAEELEYCSMVVDEEPSFCEPVNSSVQEVATWDVDNMVAAPQRVEKVAVGGLRRRNYVDMKHLKKCVWDVIRGEESLNFTDLGIVCPPKMPRSIAACMSTPLLFNALLHLTNEQNLILQQANKRGDFQISKP